MEKLKVYTALIGEADDDLSVLLEEAEDGKILKKTDVEEKFKVIRDKLELVRQYYASPLIDELIELVKI